VRQKETEPGIVAVITGDSDPARWRWLRHYRPTLIVQKPIEWDVIWRYCETQMRLYNPTAATAHEVPCPRS
jgi:hypothetical protein